MKKLAFVIAVLFMPWASPLAQPVETQPVVLDPQTYLSVIQYLNEQPAKYSRALLNLLEQLQIQAQMKKQAAEAEEKAKP